METPRRRALGKGLEELFNTEVLDFDVFENNIMESATDSDIKEIPIGDIRTNPYQPRKNFDEEAQSLILNIFYKMDNFYKSTICNK